MYIQSRKEDEKEKRQTTLNHVKKCLISRNQTRNRQDGSKYLTYGRRYEIVFKYIWHTRPGSYGFGASMSQDKARYCAFRRSDLTMNVVSLAHYRTPWMGKIIESFGIPSDEVVDGTSIHVSIDMQYWCGKTKKSKEYAKVFSVI